MRFESFARKFDYFTHEAPRSAEKTEIIQQRMRTKAANEGGNRRTTSLLAFREQFKPLISFFGEIRSNSGENQNSLSAVAGRASSGKNVGKNVSAVFA